MAWNGSGNFQRTNGSFSGSAVWEDDANAGYDIVDSRHDTHDQDLAQGINNCLTKDGQNSPTANLNMNTFKHTNVDDGTARNHYATIGQLQDEGVRALSSVGGTANAITATTIPSISAYVTGAQYTFRAIATNSGATTLKIGTAPAVAIQRNVAALVGGEIVNGRHYTVIYDGSVFQLLNTTANPLFLDSVNNRVGIGTTAPTDLLDVSATNTISSFNRFSADQFSPWLYFRKSRGATVGANTIVQSGDGLGALFFIGANGTTYTTGATIAAEVDGTPGASNDMPTRLLFSTAADGSGTPTERMRITSAGRVGIGTISPASYVSIINNESTSINTLNVQSNVSGDVATHATVISKYDNNNSTTQRFVAFFINQGSTGSGQINANNAGQAAFGSLSDVRLKENITDLPSQLVNIMTLRPVEFDYKDGSGHQIGFIAQEVQEIYPDLVGDDGNGFLTLTGLGKNEARMIKAFQEFAQQVQAKLDDLTDRVMALEV